MNLPSISEIEKSIIRIRNKDFREYVDGEDIDFYSNEIQKILVEEFGMTYNLHFPKDPGKHLKVRLFRARYLENIANINLRCEHSYPPPGSCKKVQRANLPYCSVFYASDSPETAIHELAHNNLNSMKGRYIAVSAWIIPDQHLYQITNYLLGNINNQSIYFDTCERILNNSINSISKSYVLERDSLERIIRFLGEMFVDNNYTISSHLAYQCLYKSGSSILIYPSVRKNMINVNFAIHPRAADNIILDGVYILEVTNYESINKDIEVLVHKIGIFSEYGFVWTNINKEDPMYNTYWPKIIKDFNIIE
jgi:hypothetical protein